MNECLIEQQHRWIPSVSKDGAFVFRLNRQMSKYPLMHVVCMECGDRTWFTESQWKHLPSINKVKVKKP